MKKILLHPHPILDKPTTPVTNFNSQEIKQIINELKETLNSTKNGIGLAANQIGYSKRIFYVKLQDFEKIFINPEITSRSKTKVLLEEGCLSVPNKVGLVERFKKLIVKARDESGKKFKLKAKGLLAQVVQHEIDHLDGIVYITKAKKLQPEIK